MANAPIIERLASAFRPGVQKPITTPRSVSMVDCMTQMRGPDWVLPSCSLPTAEQPLRVADFDRLFRESLRRFTRTSATRLVLVLAAEAEMAARGLAERETACCSFFEF